VCVCVSDISALTHDAWVTAVDVATSGHMRKSSSFTDTAPEVPRGRTLSVKRASDPALPTHPTPTIHYPPPARDLSAGYAIHCYIY